MVDGILGRRRKADPRTCTARHRRDRGRDRAVLRPRGGRRPLTRNGLKLSGRANGIPGMAPARADGPRRLTIPNASFCGSSPASANGSCARPTLRRRDGGVGDGPSFAVHRAARRSTICSYIPRRARGWPVFGCSCWHAPESCARPQRRCARGRRPDRPQMAARCRRCARPRWAPDVGDPDTAVAVSRAARGAPAPVTVKLRAGRKRGRAREWSRANGSSRRRAWPQQLHPRSAAVRTRGARYAARRSSSSAQVPVIVFLA